MREVYLYKCAKNRDSVMTDCLQITVEELEEDRSLRGYCEL